MLIIIKNIIRSFKQNVFSLSALVFLISLGTMIFSSSNNLFYSLKNSYKTLEKNSGRADAVALNRELKNTLTKLKHHKEDFKIETQPIWLVDSNYTTEYLEYDTKESKWVKKILKKPIVIDNENYDNSFIRPLNHYTWRCAENVDIKNEFELKVKNYKKIVINNLEDFEFDMNPENSTGWFLESEIDELIEKKEVIPNYIEFNWPNHIKAKDYRTIRKSDDWKKLKNYQFQKYPKWLKVQSDCKIDQDFKKLPEYSVFSASAHHPHAGWDYYSLFLNRLLLNSFLPNQFKIQDVLKKIFEDRTIKGHQFHSKLIDPVMFKSDFNVIKQLYFSVVDKDLAQQYPDTYFFSVTTDETDVKKDTAEKLDKDVKKLFDEAKEIYTKMVADPSDKSLKEQLLKKINENLAKITEPDTKKFKYIPILKNEIVQKITHSNHEFVDSSQDVNNSDSSSLSKLKKIISSDEFLSDQNYNFEFRALINYIFNDQMVFHIPFNFMEILNKKNENFLLNNVPLIHKDIAISFKTFFLEMFNQILKKIIFENKITFKTTKDIIDHIVDNDFELIKWFLKENKIDSSSIESTDKTTIETLKTTSAKKGEYLIDFKKVWFGIDLDKKLSYFVEKDAETLKNDANKSEEELLKHAKELHTKLFPYTSASVNLHDLKNIEEKSNIEIFKIFGHIINNWINSKDKKILVNDGNIISLEQSFSNIKEGIWNHVSSKSKIHLWEYYVKLQKLINRYFAKYNLYNFEKLLKEFVFLDLDDENKFIEKPYKIPFQKTKSFLLLNSQNEKQNNDFNFRITTSKDYSNIPNEEPVNKLNIVFGNNLIYTKYNYLNFINKLNISTSFVADYPIEDLIYLLKILKNSNFEFENISNLFERAYKFAKEPNNYEKNNVYFTIPELYRLKRILNHHLIHESSYKDSDDFELKFALKYTRMNAVFLKLVDNRSMVEFELFTGKLQNKSAWFSVISPNFAKENNIVPISEKDYFTFLDIINKDDLSQVEWIKYVNDYMNDPKNKNHVINVGDQKIIIVGIGETFEYAHPSIGISHILPNVKSDAILYVNDAGYTRLYKNNVSLFSEDYYSIKIPKEIKNSYKYSSFKKQLSKKLNSFFAAEFLDIGTNKIVFLDEKSINYIDYSSNLRMQFSDGVLFFVRLLSLLLCFFVLSFGIFGLVFFITKYCKKNRLTFGNLIANGISKSSIILSVITFALIPGIIGPITGYILSIVLQKHLFSFIKNIWFLKYSLSAFNFVDFSSILFPTAFLIILISAFAAWLVLKPKTITLVRENPTFKLNKFVLKISNLFNWMNPIWKFRTIITVNSMSKIGMLSSVSSIMIVFLTFFMANNNKFLYIANKEMKQKKYSYGLDLHTPQSLSGTPHLLPYGNIGKTFLDNIPKEVATMYYHDPEYDGSRNKIKIQPFKIYENINDSLNIKFHNVVTKELIDKEDKADQANQASNVLADSSSNNIPTVATVAAAADVPVVSTTTIDAAVSTVANVQTPASAPPSSIIKPAKAIASNSAAMVSPTIQTNVDQPSSGNDATSNQKSNSNCSLDENNPAKSIKKAHYINPQKSYYKLAKIKYNLDNPELITSSISNFYNHLFRFDQLNKEFQDCINANNVQSAYEKWNKWLSITADEQVWYDSLFTGNHLLRGYNKNVFESMLDDTKSKGIELNDENKTFYSLPLPLPEKPKDDIFYWSTETGSLNYENSSFKPRLYSNNNLKLSEYVPVINEERTFIKDNTTPKKDPNNPLHIEDFDPQGVEPKLKDQVILAPDGTPLFQPLLDFYYNSGIKSTPFKDETSLNVNVKEVDAIGSDEKNKKIKLYSWKPSVVFDETSDPNDSSKKNFDFQEYQINGKKYYFPVLSRLIKDNANYSWFNLDWLILGKNYLKRFKNVVSIRFLLDFLINIDLFTDLSFNPYSYVEEELETKSPDAKKIIDKNYLNFVKKILSSRYAPYFVNRFMTKHSDNPLDDFIDGNIFNNKKTFVIKPKDLIEGTNINSEDPNSIIKPGAYFFDGNKIFYFRQTLLNNKFHNKEHRNFVRAFLFLRPDFLYGTIALLNDPEFQKPDVRPIKLAFNYNLYNTDYNNANENWIIQGDPKIDDELPGILAETSKKVNYAQIPNGDQTYTKIKTNKIILKDKTVDEFFKIQGLKKDVRGSYVFLYQDNKLINSLLYQEPEIIIDDNNQKVKHYPIIINQVLAKKYDIKINDIIEFNVLNHSNETMKKLNSLLKEPVKINNFKTKVVKISDSFYQKFAYVSQKNANEILGLNPQYGYNGIFTYNNNNSKDKIPEQLKSVIPVYSKFNTWYPFLWNQKDVVLDFLLSNELNFLFNSALLTDTFQYYFKQLNLKTHKLNKKELLSKIIHLFKSGTSHSLMEARDAAMILNLNDLDFNSIQIDIFNKFEKTLNSLFAMILIIIFPLLLIIISMLTILIMDDLKQLSIIMSLLGFNNLENSITIFCYMIPTFILSISLGYLGSYLLVKSYISLLLNTIELLIPIKNIVYNWTMSSLVLLSIFSVVFWQSFNKLKKTQLAHSLKILNE